MHGKDTVFLALGYGRENSEELAAIYQQQAAVKYSNGNFTLGRRDEHGQRTNGKVSYLVSGCGRAAMIDNYSRVRLLTDKYRKEGAATGAVGYVIEVYDNGDCEVEFSDRDGITFAQIVARADELAVDEPAQERHRNGVGPAIPSSASTVQS